MTVIKRSVLRDAIYEAEVEDARIYDGYSGRGMYGAECLGITYYGGDGTAAICLALSEAGETEAAKALAKPGESDSMGRGMIRYWRSVTLENDVPEEDDD